MIEQIADRAGNKLHRAFRQKPCFNHPAHHQFRQIGRLASGFDDCRHAGKQRRGKLFQHAPAGKIEGVDVYRHTLKRA